MPIRVGFSSAMCSEWDLPALIERAAALGYEGVALRGLAGGAHPHQVPELNRAPDRLRASLAAHSVELISLTSPVSFETARRSVCQANQQSLASTVALARRLGCRYVRMVLGGAVGSEHRGTLSWVAEELRKAAEAAARHGMTLLLENGGDFCRSEDLWFVLDAVAHPALRGCWNPLAARALGEPPTVSVPRLRTRLAVFQACDGRFDDHGRLCGSVPLGEGEVDLARAIDLLKGVCFQGWLVADWPAGSPPPEEAEAVLRTTLDFLRDRLAARTAPLAAYKSDKQAPNLRPPPSVEAPSVK